MAEPSIRPVAHARPRGGDAGRALGEAVSDHMRALATSACGRFAQRAVQTSGYERAATQAVAAANLFATMSGAAATRTLLHPALCWWVKGASKLAEAPIAERAQWMQHAADFVWPFALEEPALGHAWSTSLDDRGGLRCVPFSRFFEFGDARAHAPLQLGYDHARRYVVARFEDGLTVHIPFEDVSAPLGETTATVCEHGFTCAPVDSMRAAPIEFNGRDCALRLDFTFTHQRKTGVNFFGISDTIMAAAPRRGGYERAIERLGAAWPEAFDELPIITRAIVPIDSGAHWSGDIAFTVSSRQGAIFLEDIEDDRLLENLVHETAHVKLRHLQLFDPLLDRWDDDDLRIPVPWRRDPRPIAGIFEGLFVFAHALALTRRLLAAGVAGMRERLATLDHDTRLAADLIERHAALTPEGRRFVAGMRGWIAGDERG